MAKLKLTIHPLFFLFGIYFACTGRIFLFLTYTLVAVIHELGHSVAAAKLGYKLNRVVLMPYGAVISGDLKGLRFSDEIEVAIAGPLTNLACAILFASVWWVFPESYAFTDVAMTASLSLCAINLLPCRPLDGGRVLHAFLCLNISERTADIVLKITGVLFSCVLGGFFVYSCFFSMNISLLFFALFALIGTLFTGKDKYYVKMFQNVYAKNVERGAEIKRVAISEQATIKRLIGLIDARAITEVEVFSLSGEPIAVLPPNRVYELVYKENIYKKIGECVL